MDDPIETNRFMKGDPVEWLDWSEIKEHGFRNETEREFLTAFFAHVQEWVTFGVTEEDCMINYMDSRLMIALDILDSTRTAIERVIKVDFTGDSILMCNMDGSVQCFFFKSDSKDAGVTEYRKIGASPADLADKAAEWVFIEFSKKRSSNPIKSSSCTMMDWIKRYL